MKNKKIIEILKGILVICGYLIMPSLLLISFLFLVKQNILPNNLSLEYFYVYLLSLLIVSLLYKDTLINDFKDFKKNYKNYIKNNLKYYIIGLFIMIISSSIITKCGINEASNQTENIKILKQIPITECILAIFIIPIIEELVFRRSLYKGINNKYIFTIITGLIFGSTHVILSITNTIELFYIIPYTSCGIALSYIYKKTDNIYSSIVFHSLHNFISLLLLII